tara:strand:+ start:625 stop:1434 length:810 start_codon:yes stop_codon:yes gene_type:complete
MAQILNSFGFHTRNVTDTDTNTNIANTNLTQDDNRTLETDGNSLDFLASGNSLLKLEEDNITIGDGGGIQQVNLKFGENNPALNIYEDSSSGTNFVKLTCGALASQRTQTLPDATGTFALLESDQTFTGNQNIEKRKFITTGSTHGDVDGDVVYFGSTSVIVGRMYYWDGSAWGNADADAASTSTGMLAIAIGTGTASSVGMCIRGMVTISSSTGGSNGDILYVHTQANKITSTAPSGSGDVVRIVGYLMDSTNDAIYFNPDGSFVEIA